MEVYLLTKCSLSASSALVASSSSSTLGFLTKALAMATLCFCPPVSNIFTYNVEMTCTVGNIQHITLSTISTKFLMIIRTRADLDFEQSLLHELASIV